MPSQHCSLSETRTALAPVQRAIAATCDVGTDVFVAVSTSNMPQPSMQAYSAPELLKPSSRTFWPRALTRWLPLTLRPIALLRDAAAAAPLAVRAMRASSAATTNAIDARDLSAVAG